MASSLERDKNLAVVYRFLVREQGEPYPLASFVLRVDFGPPPPPLSFPCSGSSAGRRTDGVGGRASSVYSRCRFRFEFVTAVLSHVAIGVMPRGVLPLELPSAGRRWVVLVLLLAALQWMEMAGYGAAP